MKKQELEFKIDQLRKDKMIFTLESIALTFVIELGYVILSIIFESPLKLIALIGLLIASGFFLYMIISNICRYNKIRKLEKELYKK